MGSDGREGGIADEIGRFQAVCPTGRLVVLRYPSQPVPDIVRDRQIIDISKRQLQEHFLQPLYWHSTFTGLDAPLNQRVTRADLQRDAEEIEDTLLGMVATHTEFFGESPVIERTRVCRTTTQSTPWRLPRPTSAGRGRRTAYTRKRASTSASGSRPSPGPCGTAKRPACGWIASWRGLTSKSQS